MNYQKHFNISLNEIELGNFESGFWKVEDFTVVNGELQRITPLIKPVESVKNIINLSEIDCIFISYDEPNAEHNWADLLSKAPWAKRVHGVKGSDAAHKAAAKLSSTERFITVDADNIVDTKFFDIEIDFNEHPVLRNKQLSWCGKNNINGLEYGNGGLKCWTKEFVTNMKTHELAEDPRAQVDFCWERNYTQMSERYSISNINTSPLQAFRAGFREGVKMTLKDGVKQKLINPKAQIPALNYTRLLVWCNVGADVENGIWAMFGARLGCYLTGCTDWDYTEVRDFDALAKIWEDYGDTGPTWRANEIGNVLKETIGLPIVDLTAEQSHFFKEVWTNPPRAKIYENNL